MAQSCSVEKASLYAREDRGSSFGSDGDLSGWVDTAALEAAPNLKANYDNVTWIVAGVGKHWIPGGQNSFTAIFHNPMRTLAALSALGSSASHNPKRAIPTKFLALITNGNIDIAANIADAEKMGFKTWWAAVASGGKWDYKVQLAGLGFDQKLLDDFGNFHFGIVAGAFGFNLEGAMYGAGYYQYYEQGGGNLNDLRVATALLGQTAGGYTLPDAIARKMTESGFTWGDNEGDSLNIMNGWDFYHDK